MVCNRFIIVHDPDGMTDAVIRNEIIYRRMTVLPVFDQLVDGRHTLIGQEHVSRLRPDRLHVVDPVCLLIGRVSSCLRMIPFS